jgi:hypothetical protein
MLERKLNGDLGYGERSSETSGTCRFRGNVWNKNTIVQWDASIRFNLVLAAFGHRHKHKQ